MPLPKFLRRSPLADCVAAVADMAALLFFLLFAVFPLATIFSLFWLYDRTADAIGARVVGSR